MSARDRIRTGFVIGASLIGCGKGRAPHTRPISTVTTPPVRTQRAPDKDRDKLATDWLTTTAVYTNRAARRLLYSWTTTQQVDGLHRDKVLLTRTQSPTKGLARFDRTIRSSTDPISLLLKRDGWNRRRFAWSNPWATIAGWPEEDYGGQLIEIRLRPDAWIGVLVTEPCFGRSKLRWSFVDMKDQPVTRAQVLAHPERLAAVLHQTGADPHGGIVYCGDSFVSPSVPFREYVIVHEEMIERWAVGTKQIRKAILTSRATMRSVQAAVKTAPKSYVGIDWRAWARGLSKKVWPAKNPPQTIFSLYEANLTWGNELYVPTEARIESIIKRLAAAAYAQDRPLVHKPDAKQLRDYWKRRPGSSL